MRDQRFFDYMTQFGNNKNRSMFGGRGLFLDGAMYALIAKGRLFLRGGGDLDSKLEALNCQRYCQIKKQKVTTVNYFDITYLLDSDYEELDLLVRESIQCALNFKSCPKSLDSLRLRDLPNMQLNLERMAIRSGISDVKTFMSLGAVKSFMLVKKEYGDDVDVKLLWKFAGALEGIHWTLVRDNKRNTLLSDCHND